MGLRDRLRRAIYQQMREAGRTVERSRHAYQNGRARSNPASEFDLPTDADGNVRIVCRRYAEQRTVNIDEKGRPGCFEARHPDCEGCAEDVREGTVESW